MKINVSSFNPLTADIRGNKERIIALLKAPAPVADLLLLPEAALCGCPLFDLFEDERLLKENASALKEIAKETQHTACVLGFQEKQGKEPVSAAAFLYKGKMTKIYDTETVEFKGKTLQIVLSDLENAPKLDADIILYIYARPYEKGNVAERLALLKKQAKKRGVPVVSCNLLGGGDGLIFDGLCAVANRKGELTLLGELFREHINTWDEDEKSAPLSYEADPRGEVLDALSFGLGDFVQKAGYSKVVFGLSGGLDSAITAVLAASALGGESVYAVSLPSYCTSDLSKSLAGQLARSLGINLEEVAVQPVLDGFKTAVGHIASHLQDKTEQQLQSRIRANLLLTLGREYGALPLSTDDLSELSVGSCVLYGDTVGRLLPLGDVFKTELYELAAYINQKREIIPQGIISRPPTSELRPNQKDEDTLPPYAVLDKIIPLYVAEQNTPAEIARKCKLPAEKVTEVCRLIDKADYKRTQTAPILKVTCRLFTDLQRPVIKKINL